MKKKMITSVSIFCLMFAGAWYVDGELQRFHQLEHPETIVEDEPPELSRSQIQTYEEDMEMQMMIEPFAPREYIRIQEPPY